MGAMSIPSLSELTWEEARDLLAEPATVAILPVGAIEAHGPHLPLATDVLISVAMARAAAARLTARGRPVLVLPPLVYTAAGFAAGFPGTISLAPETVTAAIVDIGRSLTRHGLRIFAVANAHLDPDHLASIDRAVEALGREDGLRVVFPNLTRKPWATRLSEEFKSGACHAGRFESSVVMAEREELVHEAIRRELPANPASLSDAIRQGLTTFEAAGGPDAYFGDPAAASAREGEATIDVLGSILEEAVLDARG